MVAKAKDDLEQELADKEAEKERYLDEKAPPLQTSGLSFAELQVHHPQLTKHSHTTDIDINKSLTKSTMILPKIITWTTMFLETIVSQKCYLRTTIYEYCKQTIILFCIYKNHTFRKCSFTIRRNSCRHVNTIFVLSIRSCVGNYTLKSTWWTRSATISRLKCITTQEK